MTANIVDEFVNYLSARHFNAASLLSKLNSTSRRNGERTLKDLWEASDLSANDFADEVAQFYRLPRITLPQLIAASALTAKFSRRFLRETLVFPYAAEDGRPRLVLADPTDAAAVRAAEIVLGQAIAVEIASYEDIATALTKRLGEDDEAAHEDGEATTARADDDIESLRDLASGAPVVRAVNDMLDRAMELRATDIHIEPFRNGLTVRMRVDGLLRAVPTPTGVLPQAILSRIKILAGLNIAERRLPQDGAARVRVARAEFDIRVATMPTQHGECAVIRLLPRDRGLLEIARLGLSPHDEAILRKLLMLPHGMIVVTGPTGSGKTTTLATMMTILNESTRKILTIEDPVEYEIQGVNQSQVRPSIGLTFSNALRAFRDAETANIAIHAALTGHLVLTTLHTETAAAAVPRLLDLGVEGFLLKSTLRAVIAQRLVRILCDRCRVQRTLTAGDLAADPRYGMLGFTTGDKVCEPAGCERCGGTGYRGRSGVFECLEMTEPVRKLISSNTDTGVVEEAATQSGMITMIEDAVAKCRAGITSAAEVLRVTTVR
jgi:general secretion pathway protein E